MMEVEDVSPQFQQFSSPAECQMQCTLNDSTESGASFSLSQNCTGRYSYLESKDKEVNQDFWSQQNLYKFGGNFNFSDHSILDYDGSLELRDEDDQDSIGRHPSCIGSMKRMTPTTISNNYNVASIQYLSEYVSDNSSPFFDQNNNSNNNGAYDYMFGHYSNIDNKPSEEAFQFISL